MTREDIEFHLKNYYGTKIPPGLVDFVVDLDQRIVRLKGSEYVHHNQLASTQVLALATMLFEHKQGGHL